MCFKDICYFKVNDINRHLSDHCGISVKINAQITEELLTPETRDTLSTPPKYSWNEESNEIFRNALLSVPIQKDFQNFMKTKSEDMDVTTSVEYFTKILQKTANMCLKKKVNSGKKKQGKKWYDSELENLKKDLRKQSKKEKNRRSKK
jgi:hypothetical protein